MSILDHIVLFILLFYIFFILTRFKQSFLNKNFWKIVIMPILFYSIIVGSRYGWGNDYFWYKFRFEHPFAYEDEDIGFRYINLILRELYINYVGAFIFYSLIFIITAYVLIKEYKDNKYMLALFIPATILLSTFTIRQSVAHSFVFLAIFYLNKKQWKNAILMQPLIYVIHPAAIITMLVVLFFYFYSQKKLTLLPYIITIPAYIIVSVFTNYFNEFITFYFTRYIQLITIGNKFQSYISGTDMWFGENAIKEEWKQGNITLLLSMLFHISIIYLGYISLKYNPSRKIVYIYNTVVIGLILLRLFFTFEILRRIANPLVMLYFIPFGYAFSVIRFQRHNLSSKEKKLCNFCLVSTIVYLFLYFGRFILFSPNYVFFWNK